MKESICEPAENAEQQHAPIQRFGQEKMELIQNSTTGEKHDRIMLSQDAASANQLLVEFVVVFEDV